MSVFNNGSITLPEGNVLSFGEFGKGIPLLLLHGNPGNREDWAGVAKLLGGRGFRCLAVDRPGHGKSSVLPVEAGRAADAYATLLRSGAGGKAVVIGYSMGTHFALDLAERYPDLVSGVGLVAPYLMPRDESEKPSGLPGLLNIPVLGSMLGLAMPVLAGGKIRRHLEATFRPATASPALLDDLIGTFSTVASLTAMMRDKNLFLATCKQVVSGAVSLRCPLLIVTGTKDEIAGKAGEETVKTAIPGAHAVEIADGGHALLWTHATFVADRISEEFA